MLPNALQTSATDHVPVLADEVRELLAVQPGETVVDATFGAGGHASLLAADLQGSGKLIAIDRDPACPRVLRPASRSRRACRRGSCAATSRSSSSSSPRNGVEADAILLDLGVSSMQIDRPERGFSYAADAPLDMRMDPSADVRGRELVNEARRAGAGRRSSSRYGEERYARQIAKAIVRRRREQPFERTGELVETIKAAIPAPARFGEGHPAKRVFQALRIAVNDELGSLEARAAVGVRDAAARRAACGDQLPLARGPDRQALPARSRARVRLPARLPGVRLRRRRRSCARRRGRRSGPAPREVAANPRVRLGAPARRRVKV